LGLLRCDGYYQQTLSALPVNSFRFAYLVDDITVTNLVAVEKESAAQGPAFDFSTFRPVFRVFRSSKQRSRNAVYRAACCNRLRRNDVARKRWVALCASSLSVHGMQVRRFVVCSPVSGQQFSAPVSLFVRKRKAFSLNWKNWKVALFFSSLALWRGSRFICVGVRTRMTPSSADRCFQSAAV